MHVSLTNICTLLLTLLAYGQCVEAQDTRVMQLPKAAADCIGAIRITDKLGPVKNEVGFCFVELSNWQRDPPYIMPREYAPGWFRYTAEEDGLLHLTITSVKNTDDYNWALYVNPGPWFCKAFASEEARNPIRASMCNADGATGVTGMGPQGTEPYCDDTCINPFCSTLEVRAGDQFYLYVDSATKPQSGYTIEIKILKAG